MVDNLLDPKLCSQVLPGIPAVASAFLFVPLVAFCKNELLFSGS
jgi:hypothetical protein